MKREAAYEEMLQRLRTEIKRQLPEIEANADWLWAHPETGFREWMTQKYCLEVLKKHGIEPETYPGVTGFVYRYDTGRPGPCVGILGEMDSVICKEHPQSNPETGAAHACGHAVQVASAMGAFVTLVESGVMDGLNGSIALICVPAEECLEADWRLSEIKKGNLHYLGGKPEMMYRGAFDGIDMVVCMHTGTKNDGSIQTAGRHNGFISKTVTFLGKASHAAGAPEEGINALYMATTALTALNGLRETFRDEDMVRVHPVMPDGGQISNVIPAETRLETHCRANNLEAELDAAEKFDRAMGGGAYAFGGKVRIETQPGYMPYIPTPRLDEIGIETADEVFGEGTGRKGQPVAGSEDMGDLCTIMPVMQVFVNYMEGMHHSAEHHVADRKIYEASPLYLAALAVKLLAENGKLAKEVLDSYTPRFSDIKEYCAFVDPMFSEKLLP